MAHSSIAIIGAGPSGLIAAEMLANTGHQVTIYDRMKSPGRKFLIAGRGGLNLTHSEPLNVFLTRYGTAAEWLAPAITSFPPQAVQAWCEGLGEETFIGSSGRIFPRHMKASGLLRAWLRRLDALGVQYKPQHHWGGWQGNALVFNTPAGNQEIIADATLLALGGASWPRLGSNGQWTQIFQAHHIPLAPLRPANCGFHVHWSAYMRDRFAGTPIKSVALTHEGVTRQGEIMLTAQGIEGGAVYALSASIREAILRHGSTIVTLDLRPNMSLAALQQKLGARGSKSLTSLLKSANFPASTSALLHEIGQAQHPDLASVLKALPLTLNGIADIDRAISTAGGVRREALTEDFMLRSKPGIFVAGEMLDWEAPTGGYLLQACFSTGVAAAEGMMRFISG